MTISSISPVNKYMDNPASFAVIVFTFFVGLHGFSEELYEGSKCNNTDSTGTCTPVFSCPIALKSIITTGATGLTRCTFDRHVEIVCCPVTRKSKEFCDSYTKILPIVLIPQITHGKNANLGEFPHMAALGFWSEQDQVYKFDCGGTLISNNYVVTAAHCLVNIQQNKLKIVRLGVVNIPAMIEKPDPKLDYTVVEKKLHEEYNWRKKFNDIALVKLEKKVSFTDYIRPACLYTKDEDPDNLVVTGWGAISLGGEKSVCLQKAILTPVALEQCNSTYSERGRRTITRSQMCAGDDRSDACQGDSGGPLQIQTNSSLSTIVGITSYGIGCGSKYPGVYTRIYSYVTWIEKIVWP